MAVDHVAVNFEKARRIGTFTVEQLQSASARLIAFAAMDFPLSEEERMWKPGRYVPPEGLMAIRILLFVLGALIIIAASGTIAGALLWRAITRLP